MNSLLYDQATVAPRPLRIASAAPDQAPRTDSAPLTKGSIFGPSCDGLDTVLTDYPLPRLESGDWLVFAEHGAYTFCGACAFNGMTPRPPHSTSSQRLDAGLQPGFSDVAEPMTTRLSHSLSR